MNQSDGTAGCSHSVKENVENKCSWSQLWGKHVDGTALGRALIDLHRSEVLDATRREFLSASARILQNGDDVSSRFRKLCTALSVVLRNCDKRIISNGWKSRQFLYTSLTLVKAATRRSRIVNDGPPRGEAVTLLRLAMEWRADDKQARLSSRSVIRLVRFASIKETHVGIEICEKYVRALLRAPRRSHYTELELCEMWSPAFIRSVREDLERLAIETLRKKSKTKSSTIADARTLLYILRCEPFGEGHTTDVLRSLPEDHPLALRRWRLFLDGLLKRKYIMARETAHDLASAIGITLSSSPGRCQQTSFQDALQAVEEFVETPSARRPTIEPRDIFNTLNEQRDTHTAPKSLVVSFVIRLLERPRAYSITAARFVRMWSYLAADVRVQDACLDALKTLASSDTKMAKRFARDLDLSDAKRRRLWYNAFCIMASKSHNTKDRLSEMQRWAPWRRSQFVSPFTKMNRRGEEKRTMPLMRPVKNVVVVESKDQLNAIVKAFATSHIHSHVVMGLDVEWAPPNGPASIVQLSTRNDTFIVDLDVLLSGSHKEACQQAVRSILDNAIESSHIIVCGLGLSSRDLPKLRERGILSKGVHERRVVDLSDLWTETYPSRPLRGGLRWMCEQTLNRTLDKSMQCSPWGQRPLSAAQIAYAALDARCVIDIYDCLIRVRRRGKCSRDAQACTGSLNYTLCISFGLLAVFSMWVFTFYL